MLTARSPQGCSEGADTGCSHQAYPRESLRAPCLCSCPKSLCQSLPKGVFFRCSLSHSSRKQFPESGAISFCPLPLPPARQLCCSTRPCCCLPCPAALCLLPGSCLVLDPLSDPRKIFSCLRCSSGRPAFCAPCSGSTHWDYNRGFPCEGK